LQLRSPTSSSYPTMPSRRPAPSNWMTEHSIIQVVFDNRLRLKMTHTVIFFEMFLHIAFFCKARFFQYLTPLFERLPCFLWEVANHRRFHFFRFHRLPNQSVAYSKIYSPYQYEEKHSKNQEKLLPCRLENASHKCRKRPIHLNPPKSPA